MFDLEINEKNKMILAKILALPFATVVLFSNESGIHPVCKVTLKNATVRKEIYDSSDNNEIWNLLIT